MSAKKVISVFGTSKAEEGDAVFQTAYEIGKGLAENGFVVANGGYGGTMLAASKGASDANGEVIGVTCSAFGRNSANSYVSEERQTASLDERLKTLIDIADGYVVMPGGTGTLLELADVWEHKNKGFIRDSKPIIIVGTFWKDLLDTIIAIDPKSAGCVEAVETSGEVIEILTATLNG